MPPGFGTSLQRSASRFDSCRRNRSMPERCQYTATQGATVIVTALAGLRHRQVGTARVGGYPSKFSPPSSRVEGRSQ